MEYCPVMKLPDCSLLGHLIELRQYKKQAFKALKLRRETGSQWDILKADFEHKDMCRAEKRLLEQIVSRANELNLTTIKSR